MPPLHPESPPLVGRNSGRAPCIWMPPLHPESPPASESPSFPAQKRCPTVFKKMASRGLRHRWQLLQREAWRRESVERAPLARICEVDLSYVADQTRVETHPTRKPLHLLTVTRCTGSTRQQRLPERHLRRAADSQQRHHSGQEVLPV